MDARAIQILSEPIVRTALKRAWDDSQPGLSGGHEEGGFIVQEGSGNLGVVGWPRGAENTITVSSHSQGKYDGKNIIASFHTHPNTGSNYLQEPSETDKRAVRDDPDLRTDDYVGEFVVSKDRVYLIHKDGKVSDLGSTSELLEEYKDKP